MKKFIFIIACFFSVAQLSAQDATISASVSKNTIGLAERFKFTITIANGNNAKDLRAPSLTDFQVLGGPNQSTNIQTFNGAVTQSISYSYVLQPKRVGKFSIGAAYIKVNGKTLGSQPINVEVVDKPTSTGQSQSNQQSTTKTTNQDIENYILQNVFIKTEVSDADVYKGENIVVTLKLYVNNNGTVYGPRAFQNLQAPKYDGFYANEIDIPDQQLQTEVLDGQVYKVSVIKKTILTPQKTGKLVVDPISIDAIFGVVVKRQKSNSGDPYQDMLDDFFSNPFSSGSKELLVNVKSKPVNIKVNELPVNTPANFNGAVGKFSMKTQISATATKTDEPVAYRVAINGTGNLDLFTPPALNLPPGWETFDPKIAIADGGKTFEYLLIPRSPGDFEIPSYTWSYLDPNTKKYVALASEAYKVNVVAGPGYNPNNSNYGNNKEQVEALATDIRFITKHSPTYKNEANTFFGTGVFYTLVSFPFLAGFGLLFFTIRRKKMYSNVTALKFNNANANAKKRLTKAGEFLNTNSAREFYDETIRALWGYLHDKVGINRSDMSRDNIETALLSKKVTPDTARGAIALLDNCEMSLFAPPGNHSALNKTYAEAVELITKLENEIK